MKKTMWLCHPCSSVMAECGYTIRDTQTGEATDNCEFCGRRTVVAYKDVQRGERDEKPV